MVLQDKAHKDAQASSRGRDRELQPQSQDKPLDHFPMHITTTRSCTWSMGEL
ncbi:UNVERIFIED_CONTAM: hypothetical protein FKN15_032086 [Acipenser sinensis]